MRHATLSVRTKHYRFIRFKNLICEGLIIVGRLLVSALPHIWSEFGLVSG